MTSRDKRRRIANRRVIGKEAEMTGKGRLPGNDAIYQRKRRQDSIRESEERDLRQGKRLLSEKEAKKKGKRTMRKKGRQDDQIVDPEEETRRKRKLEKKGTSGKTRGDSGEQKRGSLRKGRFLRGKNEWKIRRSLNRRSIQGPHIV